MIRYRKVLPWFEQGFQEYRKVVYQSLIKILGDNHYTIAPCEHWEIWLPELEGPFASLLELLGPAELTMLPTHTHLTEYADPVLRPPSPASSVGTAYPPDQTSFSDSEFQLSGSAFDRKCLDRIGLHLPRQDERDAEKDPLITVQGPGGRTYWVGETPLDPTAAKSSCILRVLVL